MQKLYYSIEINAPKEKVWNTMLEDKTYREWTKVFNEISYYEGTWEKGSKMLFLGPDSKTGEIGGMVSRIVENKPYEYISIEHVGIIKDGVEDTTSEEATKWTPAFENYTLKEMDGKTEVLVELDSAEEYVKMFEEMWPKGLEKLKELSEG
jgi:L-rhamnose mutarotase